MDYFHDLHFVIPFCVHERLFFIIHIFCSANCHLHVYCAATLIGIAIVPRKLLRVMTDFFAHLPTEIKQVVFDYLDDKRLKSPLVSALRVSRSWFALSVRLLWREITLHTIWYIRNSPNVAQYLSHVRSLIFGLGDDRYHESIIQAIHKPCLPNLEKIAYVPGVIIECSELDYIIPYLQPSLLMFSAIGGRWSINLLSALRETCPRLEDLRIKRPYDSLVRRPVFDSWIRDFPSIRAISIFNKGAIHTSSEDDIMMQLLERSTLQFLLKKPLKSLSLEYRLDNLEGLYNSSIIYTLSELSIALRPEDIPRLADLKNLQKLNIRIDGDYSEDIISPVASITELRSLKIIFVQPRSLRTDQIMSLTRLRKLEELEIRTGCRAAITGYSLTNYLPIKILPSFDERDFDELALSLPRLRHVCLLFDWAPNSSHILKSASCLWSKIEYLCLGYEIGLYESVLVSRDTEPFFPYLRKFPKARFLSADVTDIRELDPRNIAAV